jgi:hypothetical protein
MLFYAAGDVPISEPTGASPSHAFIFLLHAAAVTSRQTVITRAASAQTAIESLLLSGGDGNVQLRNARSSGHPSCYRTFKNGHAMGRTVDSDVDGIGCDDR